MKNKYIHTSMKKAATSSSSTSSSSSSSSSFSSYFSTKKIKEDEVNNIGSSDEDLSGRYF